MAIDEDNLVHLKKILSDLEIGDGFEAGNVLSSSKHKLAQKGAEKMGLTSLGRMFRLQ